MGTIRATFDRQEACQFIAANRDGCDKNKPEGKVIAIGFRAEANSFNWAVVTRRNAELVLLAKDTLAAPETFSEAQSLAWYRKRIGQLIDDHQPDVGSIRYPETNRPEKYRTSAHMRHRIEGVILESLASKSIPDFTGNLTTIGSEMGSQSAKAYLKQDDIRGLDWKGIPLNRKEAIMVAVAGLEHMEHKKGSHGHQE